MTRPPHAAHNIAAAAAVVLATHAIAHDGAHHRADGPWWTLWNLRPTVLIVLGSLAGLYILGVRRVWRRAGTGRGLPRRRVWIFLAGIATLAIALISPIDTIAEQLNAVHMVQHMLLIMAAAPLLILGSAGQALFWAMPARLRAASARAYRLARTTGARRYILWQPILTWAAFALVLWLLHIPKLYEAALHDRFLHDLQHIAFLASACLFWRVVLDPISSLRLNPALGVLYLFTTTLQAGALGVFMAFSPNLWYSKYAATTPAWGIAPIEDQQLAGYIMWMPACLIYALAAALIFGLWLREPEADRHDAPPLTDPPPVPPHDPGPPRSPAPQRP